MRFLLIAVAASLLAACTGEPQVAVTVACSGDCVRGRFSDDGAEISFTGAKYRGLSRYALTDGAVTVVSAAPGAGLSLLDPGDIELPATILPAGGHSPRVSPDGRFIAYIRGNDVRLHEKGSGVDRPLIAGSQPAWLPDSSAVIVAVTRDDGRDILASRLYLVSLDGMKKPLRSVPGAIPLYPDVASDGVRLLYTDHASGRILVHTLEME
jgi:Tol biopolymer transport system component